jgi:AraC-like DNA-binding protein
MNTAMYSLSGDDRSVASVRSWDRLVWLIRERPVTIVLVDSAALPRTHPSDELLGELKRRYPSVGTIFVSRPRLDPFALLRLGRANISDLVVVDLDDLGAELRRAVRRSSSRNTQALVLRALRNEIARPERDVVQAALDGALLGWGADDLARHSGWTRAHLSVRLRDTGLPSTGHLLLWGKLLHAGRWLAEPGRTAESVARQLEYSNGSAFRRAVRNYLDSTPTEVCEAGGFTFVLRCFLDVCGLGGSLRDQRSVA